MRLHIFIASLLIVVFYRDFFPLKKYFKTFSLNAISIENLKEEKKEKKRKKTCNVEKQAVEIN